MSKKGAYFVNVLEALVSPLTHALDVSGLKAVLYQLEPQDLVEKFRKKGFSDAKPVPSSEGGYALDLGNNVRLFLTNHYESNHRAREGRSHVPEIRQCGVTGYISDRAGVLCSKQVEIIEQSLRELYKPFLSYQ